MVVEQTKQHILLIECLPRTCTWHGPKGFVNSKDAKKACKLQWLKYASQSWNIHHDEIVKRCSFSKHDEYDCICKKLSGSTETYF
jgi:hypothetical protein